LGSSTVYSVGAVANERRTALYRHFDADGQLLYVGISLSAVQRLGQHKHNASWFEKIVRIEIEWWPFRDLAEQAEAAAIWHERPAWNVVRPIAEPPPAPLWNERLRSWDLDSRIPL